MISWLAAHTTFVAFIGGLLIGYLIERLFGFFRHFVGALNINIVDDNNMKYSFDSFIDLEDFLDYKYITFKVFVNDESNDNDPTAYS